MEPIRCLRARPATPFTLVLALLSGCGGGGGGASNPPPPPPPTYSIGGTVSGLAGTGLVLQNNAGADLPVNAAGGFTFGTRLAAGAAYAVTVRTQPENPSQNCAVTGGSGNVGSADVNSVTVTCTTSSFTVGGTVSGLAGTGLTLALNGGAELAISTDGAFTFPVPVASGSDYEVRIAAPASAPAQSCALTSASGTVTNGPVTAVTLACTTLYPRYVLVADQVASTVSSFAIDGETGRMLRRGYVHTELAPVGIAVNADGDRVYVANQSTDEITAYTLDKATGTLTPVTGSPFTAGDAPQNALIDPSGRFLVVPNLLSADLSVFAIEAGSGALSPVAGSPFSVASGATPADVVFDPDGAFVYVADATSDGVYVYSFNAATGALLMVQGSPFLNGGDNPADLEIAPDGRFLMVANSLSDDISVFAVNPATGALAPVTGSPFAAGDQPVSLALDPSARFLYAVHSQSEDLVAHAFNRATGALTPVNGGNAATGDEPRAVRVDPTGQWALVTNHRTSTVSAYRLDTGSGIPSPQRTHAARRRPGALAITADPVMSRVGTRHAYVANHADDTVSVLALDDETGELDLRGTAVPTGDGPIDITLHPDGNHAYVINRLDETIQAYDIESDAGLSPNGAAVAAGGAVRLVIEPGGRWAYSADIDAGTITTFDIGPENARLTARSTPQPVGQQLSALAMDPAGQYLYAGTTFTPQIHLFRIDVSSGTLTAVGLPVDMDDDVYALSIDESGTRLHAASRLGDTVTTFTIDREDGGLTPLGTPVQVDVGPRAVQSRPGGLEVYTANYGADTVSRLRTQPSGALSLAENHAVRDGAVDLAVESGGRIMLVANLQHGSVTAHDVRDGEPLEVDLEAVGSQPIAVELREIALPVDAP